jgi:hypothetical protein
MRKEPNRLHSKRPPRPAPAVTTRQRLPAATTARLLPTIEHALPPTTTNRTLRQVAALQLQRAAGNASLLQQLAPSPIQRVDTAAEVDTGVDLEAEFYDALAAFEARAESERESQSLVAAEYRRAVLLLEHYEPATYTTHEDLQALITRCLDLAESETATLRALGDIATYSLRTFPAAFPETWAGKTEEALDLDLDTLGRLAEADAARESLLAIRDRLAGEILDSGLPLDLEEALAGDAFKLSPAHASAGEGGIVYSYARALENYGRLKLAFDVCFQWQQRAKAYVGNVRDGLIVISPAGFDRFLQERAFLSGVPGELLRARDADDLASILEAVGEGDYGQFNDVVVATTLLVLPSKWKSWSQGEEWFAAKLAEAGTAIRGEGYWARVRRALRWGYARGYFGESFRELWEMIVENWGQILLITGAFTAAMVVAQFIPVLNVIANAAFLLWGGYEIFSLIREVLGVLDAAGNATGVLRLQRASAMMARLAADKLLTLVEFVAAKGIHRLTRDVVARARQIRARNKEMSEDEALRQAATQVRQEQQPALGKEESAATPPAPKQTFGLRQLDPKQSGIPASWIKAPPPLSGGQPVKLYRGFSRNAESHSRQVVRPGETGGVLSRDPAAAHDAVFNQYERNPVLDGPARAGVVEITIPAGKWDALVNTVNIAERGGYPGFSRRLETTEIRVNADEAIQLMNSCEKRILSPDTRYDFRGQEVP